MIPPIKLFAMALGQALGVLVVGVLGAAFLAFMLDVVIGPFRRGDPNLAVYGCWFVCGVLAGCVGYFGGSTTLSPLGDAWAYRPGARIVGRWMIAGLAPIYLVLMFASAAILSPGEWTYSITFFVSALLGAGFMHVSVETDKPIEPEGAKAAAAATPMVEPSDKKPAASGSGPKA